MDRMVWDTVRAGLEGLYNRVSESRNVVIDTRVRSFIANLVLESLQVRNDEWQAKTGLDPNESSVSREIALRVEKAVWSVTDEAVTSKDGDGVSHILLIGVVEQVQKKWCGIFPLCR